MILVMTKAEGVKPELFKFCPDTLDYRRITYIVFDLFKN